MSAIETSLSAEEQQELMKCVSVQQWDTDFFACKIGKVNRARLNSEQLKFIMDKCTEEGYYLLYWPSDPNDEDSQEAAAEVDALLVDEKVYYKRGGPNGNNDLAEERWMEWMHGQQEKGGGFEIKIYPKAEPSEYLQELSVMAAHVSRFKVDPDLPEGTAEGVFSRMIHSLCMRKNPLVRVGVVTLEEYDYDPFGDIAGFVAITPGFDPGWSNCPLLAINPAYRNNRLGIRLSNWLSKISNEMGWAGTYAVTQRANKYACQLYSRFGMWEEKVENMFHIHLKEMPKLPESSKSKVTMAGFL